MSDETTPIAEQVSPLMARVYALVKGCPAGSVTTYGWLAKAVGFPRGARMVGWFMNECPKDVPAQRVINSKGELSGSWAFGQKGRMRELLESEGVEFTEEGKVNLKRYGWDPVRDLRAEELKAMLDSAAADHYEASTHLLGLLQDDAASPLKPS